MNYCSMLTLVMAPYKFYFKYFLLYLKIQTWLSFKTCWQLLCWKWKGRFLATNNRVWNCIPYSSLPCLIWRVLICTFCTVPSSFWMCGRSRSRNSVSIQVLQQYMDSFGGTPHVWWPWPFFPSSLCSVAFHPAFLQEGQWMICPSWVLIKL